MMNGSRQPVKITTEPSGAQVLLNDSLVGETPLLLELSRKEFSFSSSGLKEHILRVEREGFEPFEVTFQRKLNPWLFGNGAFFLYGLIGVGVDCLSGAAYKLQPSQTPGQIHGDLQAKIETNIDPWKRGKYYGSLSYFGHLRQLEEEIEPEAGLLLILGKKGSPFELVLQGFFYSPLWEIGGLGLRKSIWLSQDRLRPYISAGLMALKISTQKSGGLPMGLWTRGGVDLRLGDHLQVGLALGYSKGETIGSGRNTGGPHFGFNAGYGW